MPDQIEEAVKQNRLEKIMLLQKGISLNITKKLGTNTQGTCGRGIR